jgi:hypothetical protein
MMNLKKLLENVNKITEDAMIESAKAKGDQYGDALTFFTKKTLPDGSKWGGDTSLKLGFDNAPQVSREKKKPTKDGMVYSAKLRFAPGKGGGSGIGMDPAASNHLFNMMGTSPKAIRGVSKAFEKVAKNKSRKLNEALRRWLKDPENFLYTIVGWQDRNNYKIEDVTFQSVRYDNPMVDPTRRRWPAGRTEIWIPVTAVVSISLKKIK